MIGCYVYGWYHPNDRLPFYIGHGYDGRAWQKHGRKDYKIGNGLGEAPCEYARNRNTKVVIYRDRLTKEGAYLVESVLIGVFKQLGAALTNETAPMRRLEVPPLVIEQVT